MRYDNGTLLADIRQFLAETGMKKLPFAVAACGNGRLFERLEKGGRVWPETEQRIRDFMASYRKQRGEAA